MYPNDPEFSFLLRKFQEFYTETLERSAFVNPKMNALASFYSGALVAYAALVDVHETDKGDLSFSLHKPNGAAIGRELQHFRRWIGDMGVGPDPSMH